MKTSWLRFSAFLLIPILAVDSNLAAAVRQYHLMVGEFASLKAFRFEEEALSLTEGATRFTPGDLNLPSYLKMYENLTKKNLRPDRRFAGPHYHEEIHLTSFSDPAWEERILDYLIKYNYGYSSDILAELFTLEGWKVDRRLVSLALRALHRAGRIRRIITGAGARGSLYSAYPDPSNLKEGYHWPDNPTEADVFNAIQKLSRQFSNPVTLSLIRFEMKDWRSIFEDDRKYVRSMVKDGRVVLTDGKPKKYYVPEKPQATSLDRYSMGRLSNEGA